MTFPVVEGVSSTGANASALNVPYPSGIAAGDLLVAMMGVNGSGSHTWPAEWTVIAYETSGSNSLSVAWTLATGSESGTFFVDYDGSARLDALCYRISATSGSVEAAACNSGSDNAPTTPGLTPSWGSADNLWLVPLSKDGGTDSVPSAPSGFGNLQSHGAGSSPGEMVVCAQQDNAVGTYDPANWTLPFGREWVATTVAIEPDGGGGGEAVDLGADVASVSDVSGDTSVARGASAVVSTTSSAWSAAGVARALSASSSSHSATSGDLSEATSLYASVSSLSGALAEAQVLRRMEATVSSHTAVSGQLDQPVYVLSHPAGGDLPAGLYDIEITRVNGVTTLSSVEIADGAYAVSAAGSPLLGVVLTPLFDRPDATGTRKCYNTRAPCQDAENYEPEDLALTFARPMAVLPKGLLAIPSVDAIETAPTRLNIGAGSRNAGPFGSRAVATVTFRDHPSPDRLVDKYPGDRGFDPLTRGTFWTKWLARNPYYQNRRLVIRDGYVGQSLEEMVRRDYLLDRIEGPSPDGMVRVVAKDALKLAEDERAQAPRLSQGELTTAVDATSTMFSVAPATEQDYPESGTLRIGREIMTYAARSVTDGVVTFSGVVRGVEGTAADSHDADERAQLCLRYEAMAVQDVLYDLLVGYGNVPAAFVDKVAWDQEAERWLQGFDLTVLITEPTGVSSLVAEIIEQVPALIWWDERARLIKLRAERRDESAPPIIDERDHIIAGSVSVREDPTQRISQVWVYWRQRDPTQSESSEANFSRIRILADLEAEGVDLYGESRIRKVYARWLSTDAQATVLARRLLRRFGTNPRFLTVSLDAKDRALWTADFVQAATRLVTDDTGAEVTDLYQVVSAEETASGHTVVYDLQRAAFASGVLAGFYMASEAPNHDAASDEQKARGGWYAAEDGRLGDGSPGHVWQ